MEGTDSQTQATLRGRNRLRTERTIASISSHKRASTIGSLSDITSPRGGRESSQRTYSSSMTQSYKDGGGESDEWCSSEENRTKGESSSDDDDDDDDDGVFDVEEELRKEEEEEGKRGREEKDKSVLFELPRSPSIFGPHSWNLLLLANYTSLLDEGNFSNYKCTCTCECIGPTFGKSGDRKINSKTSHVSDISF